MKKELTKENVILHKKTAIKKLNKTLEYFINDPSSNASKHLKKADLISYWLENYSDYLASEEVFDSKKLIAYKRGDIIKVNFGFNVGSEHGGLHYAVVLDNNNKQSSPVVTVVPLSSGTEQDAYERDVYLGNELYRKMQYKHKVLSTSALEKLAQCTELISALTQSTSEDKDKLLDRIHQQQQEAKADIEILKKYKKEIDRMKQGSIAMMEQITTISKMRIYVPRQSSDILYGISFSASEMELINRQLTNLFIK